MTVNRNQSWMAVFAFLSVLLTGMFAPLPARADVANEALGHPEVANQLVLFKQNAYDLRVRAEKLDALTPSRQADWTSHSHNLEILKEQVNQLGRTLTNLEELKPQANEGQRLAIESARPHLVGVAQQLTEAIDLLSEDRRSVYWPPYSDTVNNIYNHATSLHETVDTILDYEQARIRLLDLDLSTLAAEGS
jgi:DNA repair ATPase RecN